MNEKMIEAIENLKTNIKKDFEQWAVRSSKGEKLSGYFKEKLDNYDNLLSHNVGQKYIKLISDGSVWGFIVATDSDKKFKYGDILKAAGFNAPARNAARGNIFEDYKINWTGPNYMR